MQCKIHPQNRTGCLMLGACCLLWLVHCSLCFDGVPSCILSCVLLPVLQSIQIGTLVISLRTVLVERVIAVSAL
jgi:hypothetical protein